MLQSVAQRQRLAEPVGAVRRHGVHAFLQIGHFHDGRQRHAEHRSLSERRAGSARARHERLLAGIFGQLAYIHREVLLDMTPYVHVEIGHAARLRFELDRRFRAHRGQSSTEYVEQLVVRGRSQLVEYKASLHVRHPYVRAVVDVHPRSLNHVLVERVRHPARRIGCIGAVRIQSVQRQARPGEQQRSSGNTGEHSGISLRHVYHPRLLLIAGSIAVGHGRIDDLPYLGDLVFGRHLVLRVHQHLVVAVAHFAVDVRAAHAQHVRSFFLGREREAPPQPFRRIDVSHVERRPRLAAVHGEFHRLHGMVERVGIAVERERLDGSHGHPLG